MFSYSKNSAKLPLEQYIFRRFGCSQEILFVLQACLPVRTDLDGSDSYVFPVSFARGRQAISVVDVIKFHSS